MLSFTRMETLPASPQPVQLRIVLHRAQIETDASRLRRTAHFTDGSIRTLTINWADVTRVVAFRRDVVTTPVTAIAVSDANNIVVLDEPMQGWAALLEAVSARIALAPTFSDWLTQAGGGSHDPQSSHWTILFKA